MPRTPAYAQHLRRQERQSQQLRRELEQQVTHYSKAKIKQLWPKGYDTSKINATLHDPDLERLSILGQRPLEARNLPVRAVRLARGVK